MSRINNEELLTINGGAFSKGILFGILGLGILAVGIIDGLLRPSACNK